MRSRFKIGERTRVGQGPITRFRRWRNQQRVRASLPLAKGKEETGVVTIAYSCRRGGGGERGEWKHGQNLFEHIILLCEPLSPNVITPLISFLGLILGRKKKCSQQQICNFLEHYLVLVWFSPILVKLNRLNGNRIQIELIQYGSVKTKF